MTLKKRVALFKKGGLTTRFDYNLTSDEDFEESLKKWAAGMGYDYESIITYDVGDEDQIDNGTFFFCPRCGEYNEYGWDPEMHMSYRQDKETGEMKKAGYFKFAVIDCDNCGQFELHSRKFEEEMEKFNKELFKDESEGSKGTTEEDN